MSERRPGQPLSSADSDDSPARQIRWNFEGLARIKGMGSRAHPLPAVVHPRLPLVRVGGGVLRLVRAPNQRGSWSPEEVAHALNSRRIELRGMLSRRRDGASVSAEMRQEVVDEAISLVVMSREPIRNEQHLEGAFWATVRYLLAERRSGRHSVRVGSRRRVDLELVAAEVSDESEPSEIIETRERIARASDFLAQLEPFEQQVVSLMATQGIGVKLAARSLGVPTKTVVAAARSADQKLDQVAVIASAGRMCEYRHRAILAHAAGTAKLKDEQAARAHLAACSGCRGSYAQLVREMRGRDFQRRASAALLPPVLIAVPHGGWLDRLAILLSDHRIPSGTGASERAAGLLGGGGLAAKAAVAGTTIIVAGAGVVGEQAIHSLTVSHPSHRGSVKHHPATAATARIAPVAPTSSSLSTAPATTRSTSHPTAHVSSHRRTAVPNRGAGYLALGSSAGSSSSSSLARAASATHQGSSSVSSEPPPPSRTGGGTSLNYLGR